MSIKTQFICDKCGLVADTPKQFWRVAISAKAVDVRSDYYNIPTPSYPNIVKLEGHKDPEMFVCRLCLESLGIHVVKKPDPADQPAYPSLEDVIREIVADEIQASKG